MAELHYLSLTQLCRKIKSGELSSLSVTHKMLERIHALDPQLNSYAMVLHDQALARAEALDNDRKSGRPLGVLHGVPIAVKDLLNTKGLVTASGTRVMADFVPDHNATVIDRLEAAGAVIIGKTQLTEGAFGAHHPSITAPNNPWNPDIWSGVSSSGSGVAVAAGLAFAALGTDTGGSIRFPSACCGIVGIKPTYGRVSRFGAFELAASLDHIGPMARTVGDAARVLQALAGSDPRDPTTLSEPVPNYLGIDAQALPELVIGVDWEYVSTGVDNAVVQALREALDVFRELGADVRDVTLPGEYHRLVSDWGISCGYECAKAHAAFFPARRDEYGPVLAGLLDLGLSVPIEAYEELQDLRRVFRQKLDDLLEEVDLIATPNMITLPPLVETMNRAVQSDDSRAEFVLFTAPFDYSGHPTITLPLGLTDSGLPKTVQLVGRRLGEPTLIRAGQAFEKAVAFVTSPIP